MSAFAPFAETAAAHHERMDGGGYHRGVRAGDLPSAARALAVADMFEALAARPSVPRSPLTPETALDIMRRDVGRHLCPTTLAALEDGLASAVLRAA